MESKAAALPPALAPWQGSAAVPQGTSRCLGTSGHPLVPLSHPVWWHCPLGDQQGDRDSRELLCPSFSLSSPCPGACPGGLEVFWQGCAPVLMWQKGSVPPEQPQQCLGWHPELSPLLQTAVCPKSGKRNPTPSACPLAQPWHSKAEQ